MAVKPKYQTYDYEEALRRYYGSDAAKMDKNTLPERTAEMTDADYDTLQKLYTGYVANKQLKSDYDYAEQQAAKAKATSDASQMALYDKLNKYLPQYLDMQGLGGTGAAAQLQQDASLDLYKQRAASDKAYQDKTMERLRNYQADKMAVEQATRDDVWANYTNKAESSQYRDLWLEEADSGQFTTDELRKKFDDISYQLSDFDKHYIEQELAARETDTMQKSNDTLITSARDIQKQAAEGAYKSNKGGTLSDGKSFRVLSTTNGGDEPWHGTNNNVTIEYNGKKYVVEVGKSFNPDTELKNEIIAAMQGSGRKVKEGDTFVYNNKLYMVGVPNEDGTPNFYEVQARAAWLWNIPDKANGWDDYDGMLVDIGLKEPKQEGSNETRYMPRFKSKKYRN